MATHKRITSAEMLEQKHADAFLKADDGVETALAVLANDTDSQLSVLTLVMARLLVKNYSASRLRGKQTEIIEQLANTVAEMQD